MWRKFILCARPSFIWVNRLQILSQINTIAWFVLHAQHGFKPAHTPQSHSPPIFKSRTHSIHAETLSKFDIQFFENETNGRLTSPLCTNFIHSVPLLLKYGLFLHVTPTKHHSNWWLYKPQFLLLTQNPWLVTLTISVKVPQCATPDITCKLWQQDSTAEWQVEHLNLIFTGPCIIIYSYSTTNKMHLLSQIIYSCKTLYVFRTVFPSIIRSSKLRIQQWYMSNRCCYLLQQVAAAVWHIPVLYTQFWATDDWRKDRPKHVERFTRINNLR